MEVLILLTVQYVDTFYSKPLDYYYFFKLQRPEQV